MNIMITPGPHIFGFVTPREFDAHDVAQSLSMKVVANPQIYKDYPVSDRNFEETQAIFGDLDNEDSGVSELPEKITCYARAFDWHLPDIKELVAFLLFCTDSSLEQIPKKSICGLRKNHTDGTEFVLLLTKNDERYLYPFKLEEAVLQTTTPDLQIMLIREKRKRF